MENGPSLTLFYALGKMQMETLMWKNYSSSNKELKNSTNEIIRIFQLVRRKSDIWESAWKREVSFLFEYN